MSSLRKACALVALAMACAVGPSTQAAQHFWDVKEIYSNHDGSVQFIEFFTTFSSQQFLNAHTITATSTVGGTPTVKTFTFPSNLSTSPPNPSSTANRHMLIATPGFGALAGGVADDFPLTFTPPGGTFFNPNADSITINFGPNFDIVTFAGSLLPKDGVNSLTDQAPAGTQNLVVGVNSPTRFAGATGSVNLPPPSFSPADFNHDGDVDGVDLTAWRGGYGATGGAATNAAGNADADSDVDGADLLIWQREVTSGAAVAAAAAVPEPGGLLLVLIGASCGIVRIRRR